MERITGKDVEIHKLTDYSWEIPKKGGMNVPAVVYASEKLLSRMKEDRTLLQLKNVAMLPGILKHAIAMPDAHEGYGFPIGGVAAFDLQKGIISPGGVGYDINCLTGDSLIVSEFGTNKKLKDFESLEQEIEINGFIVKKLLGVNLKSFNTGEKKLEPKRAALWMRKGVSEVYKVTLSSGLTIKSTAEHPFLTKQGMKELRDLEGKEIAVNLFEGVPEDGSSERQLILAKITGYVMGDGHLHFSARKGYASVYGSEEDLKVMQADIARLGFSSKIYRRQRKHTITTQYGKRDFASNEGMLKTGISFARLLKAAGVPEGNKSRIEFGVPEWIKESKLSVKRAFIAGLFGAELSSPSTHTKTGFYMPIFAQNKIAELTGNARFFMLEITKLLEELSVKVNKVSEREEFVNQYGENTKRFRLIISANEDNLLQLWRNIGFEYNQKRSVLADIAVLYILKKKQDNSRRIQLAVDIKLLKKKGFKVSEIKKLYSKEINERFVERHYYENAKQRISLKTDSFDDFKNQKLAEFKEFGVVFDNITSIISAGREEVFDFNVEDNHTFIANSFVVSNCGVRLIRTNWTFEEIKDKRTELLDELFKSVPCGVGKDTKVKLTKEKLSELLTIGSQWNLENGFATKKDLDHTEENGKMDSAEPEFVSSKAMQRGVGQIGTLGSGNHFLELQKVDKIFNEEVAKQFGITKEGQITIMIHCGSRGFGHQVASDYIREMEEKFGHAHLPDRELACAPIQSDIGQKYYKAMSCAINFAFANRQMIMHNTRQSFKKILGTDEGMDLVYDVCHNIAKYEEHEIDGKKMEVCVHRKGATRSFGPGRKEIPEVFRQTGQPVFIPGSMGTASYVLVGTTTAEQVSFGSTAHGAGRVMSRSEAIRTWRGEQIRDMLLQKDIILKAASWKGVAEEAAEAYKDIDEVARVSHAIGIGGTVARLVPIAVMKG
ncbi:MAG TPA: RtcB family protein [Candidatus Nanoarchaeia archaeon]|nr:RtcB family protein [Candidatus Nanoarchaeia archaeon]